MSHTYRLAALKLASSIELPGLPPWEGAADTPPELVFRLGAVAKQLERADHKAPLFQTSGADRYLLDLPGTGRMLIASGREITVEPEAGVDPTEICALLTGPIQAVLWHQRGLLPLHAVAVAAAGRAVALAGPSGCGKSTLAAVLAAKGCTVLADDVCVARVSGDGVSVLPGLPRLRLWRDALDHLGIEAEGLRPVLTGKKKFLLDLGHDGASGPQPLAAIVLPSRVATEAVTIERLRGAGAVAAVLKIVHMRRPARALGRDPAIFASLAKLIQAGVTVWRLTLPDDPRGLAEAAATVVAALDF
jgi:hypothetical protein